MKKPQLSKQPKTSKAVELEIPRPSMAKLSTTVEPHARYQEIIKELAQARLDKKKKKSTAGK
ncbi:MAG TPA: hypothetical protein DCS66_09865 [Flavobacteriaceae bacterium]|nr:hypothetical protein [Flavobacteriaceae bacterium]